MPVAVTRISEAVVFVILNGERSITKVPETVVPVRRLTMSGPATSVWPVAITVVGKLRASKMPCAARLPDASKRKNTSSANNLNFILFQNLKNIYAVAIGMYRRIPRGSIVEAEKGEQFPIRARSIIQKES